MPPSIDVVGLEIIAASLSFNGCVVLATIVAIFVNKQHIDVSGNRLLAHRLTEILLSGLCVVGGVGVVSSSAKWPSPFGRHHGDSPSTDVVRFILSAAVGRFVFSLGRLVVFSITDECRGRLLSPPTDHVTSAWTVFRCVYTSASIACLVSIIYYGTMNIVGTTILLLEADQALEEARHYGNFYSHRLTTTVSSFRHLTLLLLLVTLEILLVIFRLVFPVTAVIVVMGRVQLIAQLDPVCLGITCFCVVFYTASALFIVKRLVNDLTICRGQTCPQSADDDERQLFQDAPSHGNRLACVVPKSPPALLEVDRTTFDSRSSKMASVLFPVWTERGCKAARLGYVATRCDAVMNLIKTSIGIRKKRGKLFRLNSHQTDGINFTNSS